MSQTKEITEDLRERVDVVHQDRKVYKTISKEFVLHNPPSDILCSNRGNSRPSREVADQQRSLQSRTCNRSYSGNICSQTKQLKAFLTLANVMFTSPPSG